MSLILAWVLFPLVLAAIAAGWGAVVERATGSEITGVLLLPLGLAAVIVFTLLCTELSITAPATTPIVGVVALVGLLTSWPVRRVTRWPLLAAIAVLLAYGAPVLLSGSATFTGYIRLDDTASFLDLVDHAMTHLHSFSGQVPSTYAITWTGDAGPTYPLGSFMLLAVGHAFTGIDSAWIFQPYLACCGVAIGLCIYALVQPLVSSPRILALVAFLGAQPALLYGYSLWGGVKELTAAFLLALGVALMVQVLAERPASARGLLPVAIAAAALILTLSAGAAAWVVPAVIAVFVAWAFRRWPGELKLLARDLVALVAMTAVFALPVWLTLSQFFNERSAGLFSSGTHTAVDRFGNLIQSLSGWQLAGIWPVGDFRLRAPTVASVLLIGLALIAASAAIWMSLRRRKLGVVAYLGIALSGCGIFYLIDASPWALGKALAVSSPSLLTGALAGGAMLWTLRSRYRLAGIAGLLALAAIGGGVIWSNVLGYHDALLAPRERLAELQHIGQLVSGKGPTFVNDYEIYADRHFLRAGDPVEPAEYRPYTLPLRTGAVLTKSAYANLNSFEAATLMPFRSIVTLRSPVESRPPSVYAPVWRGRYYQLWQRPQPPASRILAELPLGDSNTLPYCGSASNGSQTHTPCSIAPVAVPRCAQVESLARLASSNHADLVAYQRPEPIVVRGDEALYPGTWFHNAEERTLIPTTPGEAVSHIGLPSTQHYELWLGGSFSRGLDVSVDGQHLGRVKDKLANIGGYTPVAGLFLTRGVHTFVLKYPHPDLTPGSGDNGFTGLTSIALEPLESPESELLTVSPTQAKTLCGRPLEWVEVVAPSA